MASKKKTSGSSKTPYTMAHICEHALTGSRLFNHEDSPFVAAMDRRSESLVVVTGENASGKSLFSRLIGSYAGQEKLTPVSISIRERAGGGMRSVFMFGDQNESSTGALSARTVDNAFAKNLDRENGAVLLLDEPELGLSDGYTRALGELIGDRSANHLPEGCAGVLVVTHSRSLAKGLIEGYGAVPSHVTVAAETTVEPGLKRWIESTEHRTVEDLLLLPKTGHERWLRINKILPVR